MEKPEFVKIYLDPYRTCEMVGTTLLFDSVSPTEEGLEGQKEAICSELARNLAKYLTKNMAFQIYDEGQCYRLVAAMGVYPLSPEEQEAQKKYLDEYFSVVQKEQEMRGIRWIQKY